MIDVQGYETNTIYEFYLLERVRYLRGVLLEIQTLPSSREDEASMMAFLALKETEEE